jgi:aryl-alcohol dehydrogenase
VPQDFTPKLTELYRAGRFPFNRPVKFYPLADINRAMDDARRGRNYLSDKKIVQSGIRRV